MTIPETYPIHRCVYRNDAYALKELLKDENIKKHINDHDNHHNTPLHLALMLGHSECVLPLIDNGCDIVTSNTFGWSPVEEATMLGNEEIIKQLSVLKVTKFVEEFYGKGSPFEQWNEVLPNIHLKLRLKFKSKVPALAGMCPKDTIEIFKKGNYMRINTSVAGIVTTTAIPKVVKGRHSLVVEVDNEKGTLKATLMDCLKHKYQELYPHLPEWSINNLKEANMRKSSIYKVLCDFCALTVKQKKGNLLKKGKKTLHLERGKTYKADIFKIKDIKMDVLKRCKESVIGPYKSDIKTKILKVDPSKMKRSNSTLSDANSISSDENIQSVFQKLGNDIAKAGKMESGSFKDKYYKSSNDDDDDDDDSESDISDNELSERPEEDQNLSNHKSVLEKYMKQKDPKTVDPETEKHLKEMIVRGYDDDNNVITHRDIEYLQENYPNYILNMFVNNIENRGLDAIDLLQKSGKVTKNVSKDGKTIVYEVHDSIDDTLNWDEVYDMKYPDGEEEEKAKFRNQKAMNSNRMEEFDWENNKLTEESYFDAAQNENLHVGRIFDVYEEKKSFDNTVKVWMTREKDFPITLDHVRPILSYVYFLFFQQMNVTGDESKEQAAKIQELFTTFQSNKRYPIKIEVPILPVLKFQLKTIECNLDPKVIPEGIFTVPQNYEPGDVCLEKRTK